MTIDERNAVFAELQDLENKLLSSKGRDYAGNEDALNNFKASAERYGVTKYVVWSIYAGKHIDAIFNAILANPNLPRRNSESLDESIKDARNYLGLLACLLHEDLGRKHVHDFGINVATGLESNACYCGVKRG